MYLAKKTFDCSRVVESVFSKQTVIFRCLKLVKKPALKKINIYTYFLYALEILSNRQFLLKQSSIFVAIFNLPFFVRVFSKTLIVGYFLFPMQLWQTMSSCDILRMDFLCFQKYLYEVFLQHHPSNYKIPTNTWNLHFYTSMEQLKLGKGNRVC